MLAAGENHSGDPEENNVIAGDQNISGIETLQIFGVIRPAQGFKGPQSRREPGIQHIRIPLNIGAAALFTLASILSGYSDMSAFSASPGRNLVSPPKLTGNTPVTNILHPVQVGLGETIGNEFGLPFLDNTDRFLSQGFHLYKPLCRDDRLHIVMTAVACADIVCMVFDLHEIALLLEVGDDLLSGLVTI